MASTAAEVIVTIIPIVGIVFGCLVIYFYLYWNHKQKLFMIEKDNALKLMEEDNDFAAKLLWRISSKLSERLSQTTRRFSESQEQSSDISDKMQ